MKLRLKSSYGQLLGTIGMILIALFLGGILIALTDNQPITIYGMMIKGAVGTIRKITELFVKLIPILLMGLGVSIAFKAKIWNIGAEGQFIMASIAGAAVALYIPLPFSIRSIIALAASVAAGAIYAGIAGWLKNRFGANEVITTLMLNYIAAFFLLYLINGPMQDPNSDLPQSDIIPEEMHIPYLLPNSRLHIGLIVLVLVIVFMIVFWKSTMGYKIDLIGQGEKVSTYAGVNVKRTVMTTMLLSGALVGLAGWGEMFGIQFRVLDGIAGGYGNIATIIALLGSLNVYGIIASATFFSILICGGAGMQRMTDVPYSVVDVIQGLIIILVIARNALGEKIKIFSRKRREAAKEKTGGGLA